MKFIKEQVVKMRIIFQYFLFLTGIAASLLFKSAGLATLYCMALIFFYAGVKGLQSDFNTRAQKQNSYYLALLACLVTLPFSLLCGWPAIKDFKKRINVVLHNASAVANTNSPQNELTVTAPKARLETGDSFPAEGGQRFYARKIFGSGAYYVGIFLLIVVGTLLVSGNYHAATRIIFPAFMFTFFGLSNRKPRIVITANAIFANPNSLARPHKILLADIAKIQNDKKFRIILKTGIFLPLPAWEFSQATRRAMAKDVEEKLGYLRRI